MVGQCACIQMCSAGCAVTKWHGTVCPEVIFDLCGVAAPSGQCHNLDICKRLPHSTSLGSTRQYISSSAHVSPDCSVQRVPCNNPCTLPLRQIIVEQAGSCCTPALSHTAPVGRPAWRALNQAVHAEQRAVIHSLVSHVVHISLWCRRDAKHASPQECLQLLAWSAIVLRHLDVEDARKAVTKLVQCQVPAALLTKLS